MTGERDGESYERELELPRDVALLEQHIVEHDAVLVIIDVLEAYLADHVRTGIDQHVRKALRPVAEVAKRTGACIVVLRHLLKPDRSARTKAIYEGGGSIGIIGAARLGLLMAFDPDDADLPVDDQRRVLAASKVNIARHEGSLSFRIVGEGWASRIEWLGASEHRANDLVSLGGDRAAQEPFAVDLLEDGPMLSKEIYEVAKGESWSSKQMLSTLHRIGAHRFKDGYQGPWTSELRRSAGAEMAGDDEPVEDPPDEPSEPAATERAVASVLDGFPARRG